MRLRHVRHGLLGLALAGSLAACGNKEASSTSAEPGGGSAPAGQKVDTSTAGDVKGTVAFEGTAPKNEGIKMNADPVCMRENKSPQFQETFMVSSDGKALANVFVYVKDGLGNYVYDTPTEPVTIDQKECRYHPHVFGMRVGQRTLWRRSFSFWFSRLLRWLRQTGLNRLSADVAQIPALAIARVLDAITPMLALRRLTARFSLAALGGVGRDAQNWDKNWGNGGAGENAGENRGREFRGSV